MREITTIFTHDGGTLGIDEGKRLYWNGQLIVTKQVVTFECWVNCAVIVGGVSTFAIAIFTGLLYFCPR